ncbi:unnamed protein product [Cyprideis torosa]|uniref:Uncharacterized protein n=1 Tax=Cyprideis torosa TaxID=163714 RepID=A0A7R8ZLW6_9CRUS|nr:unnamed protein product [Cyprideis torosa]CAG0887598.1 unnamed protein product [Cyprideis torosa]
MGRKALPPLVFLVVSGILQDVFSRVTPDQNIKGEPRFQRRWSKKTKTWIVSPVKVPKNYDFRRQILGKCFEMAANEESFERVRHFNFTRKRKSVPSSEEEGETDDLNGGSNEDTDLFLDNISDDVSPLTRSLPYPTQNQQETNPNFVADVVRGVLDKELPGILNPCGEGLIYHVYSKKCYKLFVKEDEWEGWNKARAICRSLDMRLPSIHSAMEEDFLRGLCTIGDTTQEYRRAKPCWTGASSKNGAYWNWDNGDIFGDIDLLLQVYTNPAANDSCMAVFPDDAAGTVYDFPAHLKQGDASKTINCATTRLPFVCESKPPKAKQPSPYQRIMKPDSGYEKQKPAPIYSQNIFERIVQTVLAEVQYLLNPCEENWYYSPESDLCYYHESKSLLNWFDALEVCEKLGGTLPSFENRLELNFLHSLCTYGRTGAPGTYCWIGARSLAGKPYAWTDNARFDIVRNQLTVGPDPAPADNCLAMDYDDFVGPTFYNSDKERPHNCYEDLNAFACQKKPMRRGYHTTSHQNDPNDHLLYRIRFEVRTQLEEALNPCEKGWVYYAPTNKCFTRPSNELTRTFVEARHHCSLIGATLPSFQSRKELLFLHSLCPASGVTARAVRSEGSKATPGALPSSTLVSPGAPTLELQPNPEDYCWIGASSIKKRLWAWESGEAWSGIEEHLPFPFPNPALTDSCLVVTQDDSSALSLATVPFVKPENTPCNVDRRFICQRAPRKHYYSSSLYHF